MKEYYLNCNELKNYSEKLNVGDKIYLSGYVYTARDAAHERISEMLKSGASLPFDLSNSVIYYAGPTPTPEGMVIGSCGPTTSSRMDAYAPALYDLGITATIGKGMRSDEVIDSIKRNKALYLCAIGGAGALAALCIKSSEVIDFEDLGCESVKKLEFDKFPVIVGVDCYGNSIFK